MGWCTPTSKEKPFWACLTILAAFTYLLFTGADQTQACWFLAQTFGYLQVTRRKREILATLNEPSLAYPQVHVPARCAFGLWYGLVHLWFGRWGHCWTLGGMLDVVGIAGHWWTLLDVGGHCWTLVGIAGRLTPSQVIGAQASTLHTETALEETYVMPLTPVTTSPSGALSM